MLPLIIKLFLLVQTENRYEPFGVFHLPTGIKICRGLQVPLNFIGVLSAVAGAAQLTGKAQIIKSGSVFPNGLAAVAYAAAVHGVLGGEYAQQGGLANAVAAN